LALLGLAGSTATLAAGWLAPALIALSLVLMVRAFYILYVRRRGNRASAVITWLSAAFIVGFWTWQLFLGDVMREIVRNLLAAGVAVGVALPW
jgi:hypothetical protein